MVDVIVIGAGPAGLTAAIYLRRAEKSVLIIEKECFGGQITHSPRVENYPGYESLSGAELGDKLFEHATSAGADVELDTVTGIEAIEGGYRVVCEGAVFDCRAVIIATGSRHRTLGLLHEEELVGEGVSYCAVCDGAFYKDQRVAVVGGGNSALQDAVLLSDTCSHVTVVQNLAFLTGEEKLLAILAERGNVDIILSTVVDELIVEDGGFKGLSLKGTETGEMTFLPVDGVFVAIGRIPENEPFRSAVELDERGYVRAGEDCRPNTAFPGVFVAGDCRTKAIRQVTTATADGAVAALAACRFLNDQAK